MSVTQMDFAPPGAFARAGEPRSGPVAARRMYLARRLARAFALVAAAVLIYVAVLLAMAFQSGILEL